MRDNLLWLGAMLGLLISSAVGCGQPAFYECEGIATHDGKPIADLEITFSPDDPDLGRPPISRTDKNGRFQMTTGRENGMIPGAYTIHVMDPGAADGRQTSTEPDYLYVIDRYSPQKSDLKYVADKHQTNFELKLDTKEYTGPPVKTQKVQNTTGE